MIDIKTFRRELGWDANRDSELVSLRQEMIDLWEGETGRLFNARTGYIETLQNAERRKTIMLRVYPVTTITTVEHRTNGDDDWDALTNDASTTYWVPFGSIGVEKVSGTFRKNVRVTYDGGWTTAPLDVQRALVVQAKFQIARFSEAKVISKSESFGEGAVGGLESAYLHPYFSQVAKRYRRRSL